MSALKLPNELQEALVTAARFHDLGKKREVWQRSIGNPDPTDWYAKSGRDWEPRDICPDYRHEFGSLLDVEDKPAFKNLRHEMRDLILHLIASHHGRGRPHFPAREAYDIEPNGKDARGLAGQVPQRFARL